MRTLTIVLALTTVILTVATALLFHRERKLTENLDVTHGAYLYAQHKLDVMLEYDDSGALREDLRLTQLWLDEAYLAIDEQEDQATIDAIELAATAIVEYEKLLQSEAEQQTGLMADLMTISAKQGALFTQLEQLSARFDSLGAKHEALADSYLELTAERNRLRSKLDTLQQMYDDERGYTTPISL